MKRGSIILIALLLALVLPGLVVPATAQDRTISGINSARYIVIDADTGYVFAEQGAHDRVAIASVTKVFTALQAMEMAPLDTMITTKDSDLRAPGGAYFGSSGTTMGFSAGQTFTLEELLYGMLLPSGNDASNAIARALGYQEGDTDEEAIQRFLDLTNQRLQDMGLHDTHLMNAHGWGVDGHYSTASDIASFARLVMNYPKLMEMMGTQRYTTSNGAISMTNTNRSLNLFPSVIGGKTGFDFDSGYCLLNWAQRGDVRMISVILDGIAPNDWYFDSARLLDYGFDQHPVMLSSGAFDDANVATFADPAPARAARAVDTDASFSPGILPEPERPVQDVVTQPEPVVEAVAPLPRHIVEPSVWTVAGVAAFVVLVQGFATFAGFRPRNAREESDEEPIADIEPEPATS